MTVLRQGSIPLILVVTLFSRLDAEPCRTDGSLFMCQVFSDSYHQNTNESLESTTALVEHTDREDIHIDIKIPCVHLTEEISFNNRSSLTISGDSSSATIINCTHLDGNAGIVINNIRNLTLKHLVLIYCGSELTIRNKNYSSALTVRSCGVTSITNITITESRGTGLMILNHQEGLVRISWSNFTKNKILHENFLGGGGLYIGKFQRNYSSKSSISESFIFEYCVFEQNVAHTRHYYSFYTNEFGEGKTGFGQGGGIFMAFESNIIHSHVSVLISNCKFIKNRAFLGGGLSIKIGRGGNKLTISKITIAIENSLFESNGCNTTQNTSIGGGVHLSYHLIDSIGCEYKLWNVTFTHNCAEFGGGAFFFSDRHNSKDNTLLFDSCTFEKNNAHMGSAVDMIPSSSIKLSTNLAIVPVFRDCIFLENNVFITLESSNTQGTKAAGIGTIYASLFDVKFEGETRFENNKGTAVYMVNGIADLSNSSATFDGNRGIRGGAIALLGESSMIVGPNREYTFQNNTALYQGGAIFKQMIDTHDFTLSRSCFIQYYDNNHLYSARDWNNSIKFYNNRAKVGHTIFITSLNPCLIVNNNTDSRPYYITVNVSEVFSRRGIEINESDVATEGAKLRSEHSQLHVIPGKRAEHRVTVVDDTQNNVSEPLRINIKKTADTKVELDTVLSIYVGEEIQLKGQPGDKIHLSLQTVSTRQSYTTLLVDIAQCPPGFKLENYKCICNSKEYYGLLECDNDHFRSILSPGVWIGNISDEKTGEIELATSICPRSFCDYYDDFADNQTIASVIKLPQNHSDLERAICGKRRQGILCGNCAPNHTTHFHSPNFQCNSVDTSCKAGWLFYIFSELVPVTVVFITVIVFDISFTSGAINGFILFSQVLLSLNIDASGIIRFPQKREVIQGYQFLYGFLNLDFFTIDNLSFCLWPNATALHMLAFKYITIVYALSLVVLVIWFINRCGGRCLGRWCRITTVKSSVIHGISAFLIICYSQTITVSHSLLNGAELWRKRNSTLNISKRVWHNGNMKFFSEEHLPYAIPALFCLLTIGVLPPMLLLSYPSLNKIMAFIGLEESKFMHFISQKLIVSKIKPLLDTFQGCFKDNLRFFAGLYFIYRWIAPVVNSATSSLGTAYITYEILLILMLALHALFQPYQKTVHNVIDTLLFTNLLLINSITCIHYYLFQSQESRHTFQEYVSKTSTVQMTLIYLPIFMVMLYLLVIGCKYVYDKKRHRNQSIVSGGMEQPVTQTLKRLRAMVRPIRSLSGDIVVNDEELPHRFIAGEVSYECFEDTDYAGETPTNNTEY